MTALRKGIDPNTTTYNSHPLNLNTAWGPWKVNTYRTATAATSNLVQATLQSDNTVFAQLDLDVGPDAVRQIAYDMGVTTQLDGYPAEGLGGLTLGVSPLEMANVYATIADGGYRNKPIAIRKVVFPDGKSENLGRPKRKKAFSDAVTSEATKILRQNMQSGTATRRCDQLSGGRQDGHDRRLHRRLARRIHAASVDIGVGGLSQLEGPDDGRARDPGERRQPARPDLARLHVGRRRQRLRRLPGAPRLVQRPAVLRLLLGHGRPRLGRLVRQATAAVAEAARTEAGTAAAEARAAAAAAAAAEPPGVGRRLQQPEPATSRHRSPHRRSRDRRATAEPVSRPRPGRGAAAPPVWQSVAPRGTCGARSALRPDASATLRPWQRKRRSSSKARSSRPCRTRCFASSSTTIMWCSGTSRARCGASAFASCPVTGCASSCLPYDLDRARIVYRHR